MVHSKTHGEFANNVYKERIRGSLFIATSDGKRGHFHFGCWSTQCSHEPPRMLTCFPKELEGYDIVKKGGVWTVNIVPENHKHFHEQFHFEGKQDVQSLGEEQFVFRKTGCPILKDAVGFFECELVSFIDNGDFGIAIGDIVNAEMLNPDKKNVTVNEVVARGFLDNREKIQLPFKGFDLQ